MRNSIKIVIAFYLVIYSGISYAQNTENYKEQDLNFISNGNKISGKLIIPLKEPVQKLPMVVFVHGSGPEDYSSSDNYSFLFEKFTEIGFACYSWDRPGVGNSEGKWYEKSVKERAQEVIDAVKMLKTIALIDSTRVGFWGISQAGWVIPEVAGIVAPAFVISVSSPATTAVEQELYRVETSMRTNGFSRKDIKKAISYTKAVNTIVDTDQPYVEFANLQKKIKDQKWVGNVITGDETVYRYLSIVFKDDEPPAFKNLNCPVLAIWGKNDLVVPSKKSARIFENKMKAIGNQNFSIKIVADADHTMTFNVTGKSSATRERREQYKHNPKEIFAPGYVSLMTDWLTELNFENKSKKENKRNFN